MKKRIHLGREDFGSLVEEVLAKLPKKFRDRLENVAVVIEDSPSPEALDELGLKPPETLFGLYQGVPLKRRGFDYGNNLPDRIVIYQRPIEAVSQSLEEVAEQIRRTVMHEVGHFFGLEESDLRRIEEAKWKGKGAS